jgi:hypothetical protein
MASLQKAAEFPGYVSESSSFCPFILLPNQDRTAKAPAFAPSFCFLIKTEQRKFHLFPLHLPRNQRQTAKAGAFAYEAR